MSHSTEPVANKKPRMVDYPEYRVWCNMKARCYGKTSTEYRYYGAKGVSICEEWRGREGFWRFIEYIGRRPSPKHSIDRIDVYGNYEPGNVRWTTFFHQSINKRNSNPVPGVCFVNAKQRWKAYLQVDNVSVLNTELSCYENAVVARRLAQKLYHGM